MRRRFIPLLGALVALLVVGAFVLVGPRSVAHGLATSAGVTNEPTPVALPAVPELERRTMAERRADRVGPLLLLALAVVLVVTWRRSAGRVMAARSNATVASSLGARAQSRRGPPRLISTLP